MIGLIVLMVPTWSAFLVHYFLHSSKHNLLSSQRRTTSIAVCVVPWGACSFSFFFYLSPRICRVSALLGQLCLVCLSSSSSSSSSSHARVYTAHLREYSAAPHHRFMLTCLANIHAQDARPEMNTLSKKEVFSILFSRFLLLFNLFQLSYRCPTVVR